MKEKFEIRISKYETNTEGRGKKKSEALNPKSKISKGNFVGIDGPPF